MRAIILQGPLSARNARVVTFGGASAQHRKLPILDDQTVSFWEAGMQAEQRPLAIVAAANVRLAYARIRALFEVTGGAPRQNLMIEVDDASDSAHLPPDYPEVPGSDRDQWLRELVDWWQLERSELVGRGIALFNHGERIHSHWGDQVDRAVRMLEQREGSSRARSSW